MDQNWGTLSNVENTENTDHNQRNKNSEEADDWKSNLIQAGILRIGRYEELSFISAVPYKEP